MASAGFDPLVVLQDAVTSHATVTPVVLSDDADKDGRDVPVQEAPLAKATHLAIKFPPSSSSQLSRTVRLPTTMQTRFFSILNKAVDVRSIWFAHVNREVAPAELGALAERLNAEGVAGSPIHKFQFVERVEVIAYLEGGGDEFLTCIKPAAGKHAAALAGAGGFAGDKMGAGAGGSTGLGAGGETLRSGRAGAGTIMTPRMAEIYGGERRMGDRNSVLQGIKPTDFSHVRKLTAAFLSKKPSGSGALAGSAALALNPKQAPQAHKRPDPIILLSPSASSLLRMTNARAFLEEGRFVPPDHNAGAAASHMLHVSRMVPSIDSNKPMRFILIEGPEQFKPEYWNRVVAVFTTGQAWQFKSYRWSNANELFKHVPGIFLGWHGESVPDSVRDYGQRVVACSVAKWQVPGTAGGDTTRWKDREAVEMIWRAVEANMRAKGWRKDTAPDSI